MFIIFVFVVLNNAIITTEEWSREIEGTYWLFERRLSSGRFALFLRSLCSRECSWNSRLTYCSIGYTRPFVLLSIYQAFLTTWNRERLITYKFDLYSNAFAGFYFALFIYLFVYIKSWKLYWSTSSCLIDL